MKGLKAFDLSLQGGKLLGVAALPEGSDHRWLGHFLVPLFA